MDDESLTNQAASALSQSPEDIIKRLWDPTFQTLFKVRYQEKILSELADKWLRFDTVSNILVALTASGSAVAGWAVWHKEFGPIVWAIFAGLVSVLSIIHNGLQVPTRLKELIEFRREFTRLRIDLETFWWRLKWGYVEKEMLATYEKFRGKYADLMNRGPSDIAETKKLRDRIDEEVKEELEDDIEE